jgi:hypothetical protein
MNTQFKVEKVWLYIGIVFSLITIYQYMDRHLFIKNSTFTLGKVIRVVITENNEGDNVYWPVIRFLLENNSPYIFKSNLSNDNLYIGDEVPVLYLEDEPLTARIASFEAIWLPTIILGGISVSLLAIGLRVNEVDIKKLFRK